MKDEGEHTLRLLVHIGHGPESRTVERRERLPRTPWAGMKLVLGRAAPGWPVIAHIILIDPCWDDAEQVWVDDQYDDTVQRAEYIAAQCAYRASRWRARFSRWCRRLVGRPAFTRHGVVLTADFVERDYLSRGWRRTRSRADG
jgi:hypothetical protein